MNCPRCRVELVTGRAGALTAHGCRRCAGVWLDNATSQRVVGGLSEEAIAGFRAHSANAEVELGDPADGGALTCPQCDGALERKRVDSAWLDVDICLEHGTWFDCGEVEKIAAAMKRKLPSDWRAQSSAAAPVDDSQLTIESPYVRGFRQVLLAMHEDKTDVTVTVGPFTFNLGNLDD